VTESSKRPKGLKSIVVVVTKSWKHMPIFLTKKLFLKKYITLAWSEITFSHGTFPQP
jgi:hypothetical protein